MYDKEAAEAKTRQALDTLVQGISQIVDSQSFQAYLTFLSRFHNYSAGNVALIQAQDSLATRVAGYTTWQRMGRQVRKGEHGIKILVPHKVKVEAEDSDDPIVVVRNFGIGTVFDIRQTEGSPLPEPPVIAALSTASAAGDILHDHLLGFLEAEGISVVYQHTEPVNGYYEPDQRRIALGLHLSADHATKTLAHETAHYVAGHHGFTPAPDAETIAESTAFVVLQHFGIDTSSYSFPYVANWARNTKVLKRNLAGIQKTANHIIEAVEGPHEEAGGGSFRSARV